MLAHDIIYDILLIFKTFEAPIGSQQTSYFNAKLILH